MEKFPSFKHYILNQCTLLKLKSKVNSYVEAGIEVTSRVNDAHYDKGYLGYGEPSIMYL